MDKKFTGLKDKNGVEIYEGDIVDCNGIGVIEWIDGAIWISSGPIGEYTASTKTDKYELRKCEVIGNIYENPDIINN